MQTFTPIMLAAQAFASLLWWIGIALVAERTNMSTFTKRSVQIMSAVLLIAWTAAIALLAQHGAFGATRAGAFPAVLLTLLLGFSLFSSQTFRNLLGATPRHWMIGIQVFRVLGGIWLIGYVQGLLPGLFALPAGIGDTLTGITAPLVAYWAYKNGTGARLIASVWNMFGTLDLLVAITLGTLVNLLNEPGAARLVALPFVLIAAFGVPRSLLLHGYTFWLLGKRKTEKATLQAPISAPVPVQG
jgi:hypothetical protein